MRAGAWDGVDVRRVRFAYPPGIQPMHLLCMAGKPKPAPPPFTNRISINQWCDVVFTPPSGTGTYGVSLATGCVERRAFIAVRTP